MSLFSRFRKAPPPAPPAPSASQHASSTVAAPAESNKTSLAAIEEEKLKAAVEGKDLETLSTLVIEGTSTKVRQAAAEAIDDPEHIRRLIKRARGGNDKNVYKILARKRDEDLAREREAEQLQAEIAAISSAIEKHSRRAFDPLFAAHLQQLEERWNVVASQAQQEVAERTQRAIDQAREVIAQHLREVAAQASRELAAQNAAAAAQKQREEEQKAAQLAEAERAQQRQLELAQREVEAQRLRTIGGLLRKAQNALASGNSKSASGLRRAIDEKLVGAPPLPAGMANQLKQLDARLDELKDWKSFTVAPKRAELIERMEGLIGATMHPTALAGHIKNLQEQWRTLSKGAGEGAESDWQRFNEAAQKAFEPCREYFQEQDRLKAANLAERGKVYERLRVFADSQDWDQVDWRNVITVVREAKQLWREHAPVDPSASADLQSKFSELVTSLQTRIDAEYASNLKAKRSLIERARSLVTSTDSRAAIDEVKRLQEKWKSVGPTPRQEDQALWDEFRQQCDAVFARRDQEQASHRERLETSKAQAIQLCETLEQIASLTDSQLLERAKELADLRAAFSAIDELPRDSARQLQSRFERAFERSRQAIQDQKARDAERGWLALLEVADQVRAYRLAIVRGENAERVAELKNAAEASLNAAAGSPKRGIDALKSALAQTANADLAANEQALRLLCIRAEILTGADTPAEDQALRREYQVKRLMQNMGAGIETSEGEFDQLLIEWLGVGPTDDATYSQLAERFKVCRRRRLAR